MSNIDHLIQRLLPESPETESEDIVNVLVNKVFNYVKPAPKIPPEALFMNYPPVSESVEERLLELSIIDPDKMEKIKEVAQSKPEQSKGNDQMKQYMETTIETSKITETPKIESIIGPDSESPIENLDALTVVEGGY